jgi:hypothetical protein
VFEEPLPRELPACRELCLGGLPISTNTLMSLASCSLPALERAALLLVDVPGQRQLLPQVDLAWAAELPQLRELQVGGLLGEGEWEDVGNMLRAAGSSARLVELSGEGAQAGKGQEEGTASEEEGAASEEEGASEEWGDGE